MSQDRANMRAAGQDQRPMGPMGRGGPMGMVGMPVQKAKDFRGTLFRLFGYFQPQKYLLMIIIFAAIIGTVFNIVGPKILGLATTKLFEGVEQKLQDRKSTRLNSSHVAISYAVFCL